MKKRAFKSFKLPRSLKTTELAPLHKLSLEQSDKNNTGQVVLISNKEFCEKVLETDDRIPGTSLHQPGRPRLTAGLTVRNIYNIFAKVFDKCDHGVLASDVRTGGITGKLGCWDL